MNHLSQATSPYLRQHANNPVDWYEWGEDALLAAANNDKPILLSIGYSACHWCHVMAHESFEDPQTADIMNRDFIAIKVDREERPDLDDIYMQATLMFNQGNGGWPMTVFLTPDGRPFHAGTYYPPTDRYGRPSFRKIMAAVVDAYRNRRAEVEEIGNEVAAGLQRADLGLGVKLSNDDLTVELLQRAYEGMEKSFDEINGGLTKGSPKFPNPMNLEFVLRYATHNDDKEALNIVAFSLKKMANGGIYDQVGGGFSRYSVDERWLVPHFEKMLYDNAQLSRLYLHTWGATGDPFFKRIAEEIYDYILREMTSPEGGFYSATDADSEGEEGKYFLWTPAELRELLPSEQAEAVILYWDVTESGNFEGKNILNVPQEESAIANQLGISIDELRSHIDNARHTLYAARTHRIPPGLDDKVLTSWNGMMLASLAEGARLLKREDYRAAVIRNVDFLLKAMNKDGRLLHSYKDGRANLNGYLEDYANLIDGLIQVYQLTAEPSYFAKAIQLAETVMAQFAAPEGGFFDTSNDHEKLIARPRSLQDNAIPSGNSMIAKTFAQLSAFTGDARFDDASRTILRQLTAALQQYPTAFGEALNAADLLVRGTKEVAVVGDPHAQTTKALLDVVNTGYRPALVLAIASSDQDANAVPALLTGRGLLDGKPAAYVCEHFVCKRPVSDPVALGALLNG